jgi:hypothetical protein
VLLAIALGAASTSGRGAEPPVAPELMIEEAFYREVALADPQGAIRGYEQVLALPALPPRLAARARLRLGIACELLGRADLAREHFRAVSESHAAETDALQLARRRLGDHTGRDPARFMPADVLFHAELVEPAEHIRGFSKLLEGTAFQNPVDYSLRLLAPATPGEVARDGLGADREVSPAAAFLNEAFLRELQKVEGFALAVPGDARGQEDFLAVLLPGKSDILRGLVQMGLTLSKATVIGHPRGIPIFRTPPAHAPDGRAQDGPAPAGAPRNGGAADEDGTAEGIHVAIGADFIVFGNPAELITGAIERSAGGAPSLADAPDFREAEAARSGNMAFVYLGKERIRAALRAGAKPEDLPALNAIEATLGVEALRAPSLTLGKAPDGDVLTLSFRARFAGKAPAFWRAVETPAAGPGVLAAVPPEAPIFFTAGIEDGPAWWDGLHAALAPLRELAASDPQAARHIAAVDVFLSREPGRALLAEIEALAAGAWPEAGAAARTPFAILRTRSAERGRQVVEEALAAALESLYHTAGSREFRAATIPAGERQLAVRAVEPFPGFRVYVAEIAGLLVVTPSAGFLQASVREGSQRAPPFPWPRGARKVLFVRPAAFLEAEPAVRPELHAVLTAVSRLVVSTREAADGIAIDVHVPEVTAAARAALGNLEALERRREGEGEGERT